MKKMIFVIVGVFSSLLSLLLLSSCKSTVDDSSIITIDVSKNYPVKEIDLKTIADIQYLILEDNNDDFLFKGLPRYITDNTLVIIDNASNDIMFFSRDGKPKSKFNRKGNGPEEYVTASSMVYDEDKDELFVVDRNRVFVYSSEGKFIRNFKLLEGVWIYQIREFDDKSLIIYDDRDIYETDFSIISKEDGTLLESIVLPEYEKMQTQVRETDGEYVTVYYVPSNNLVKHKDGVLLNNHSSDTLFLYNRNRIIKPFLVRTPQIRATDPVIYLNSLVESSEYQFFQAVEVKVGDDGVPWIGLMREKSNNNIYTQKIVLNDFRGKEIVITPNCISNTNDPGVGFFNMDIEELSTANAEGRLSGELKKITEHAEQSDNGNNVYMFVYFR